jgi:hypothetical protein
MIAWNVYLGTKLLTTIYYTDDCDAEYVRSTLINHDGYDSRITVRRVWKK